MFSHIFVQYLYFKFQNLSHATLFRKGTKEPYKHQKRKFKIHSEKNENFKKFLQLTVSRCDNIFMIIKTTVFKFCSFYGNTAEHKSWNLQT